MKIKSAALSAALLGALTLGLSAPAQARDKAPAVPATLQVTGQGEYRVAPDIVTLSFEVSAYEDKADTARDKVEETVTAFTGALQSLKLPEKSVVAQSLSIYPRHEMKDGKVERIMYSASRNVTVRLEDFAQIATVTDLAMQSGINQVSNFSYELKDEKAARREARRLAIADAKDKAGELSSAFDMRLTQPVSLSYENQGIVMPRNGMRLMAAAAMDSAGASGAVYTADDITVNATVYVTYAMEPEKKAKD